MESKGRVIINFYATVSIFWPIKNGTPTIFLGQFDIPKQGIFENRFTGGITIYVFGYRKFVQECNGTMLDFITFYHNTSDNSQSADEHYRDEDKAN